MAAWYEDEVRALEKRALPPPDTALLLYGSSSIRLWSTDEADFPGRRVVNRGFGGATLSECNDCFARLVRPVRPAAVLLYAGDNDVEQGASADAIVRQISRFAVLMADFAPIPWAFVSIKPSPSRRRFDRTIRWTNFLARALIGAYPNASFVDIYASMRDESDQPPFKYFSEDWLHMNRAGYALWSKLLAPWVAGLPDRTRL